MVRAAGLAVAPPACDADALRVDRRCAPGHVLVIDPGAPIVQSAVEHKREDACLARVHTPLRRLADT